MPAEASQIFLDHIPNNIGSWLTLRNYGFSSGLTRQWRTEPASAANAPGFNLG
jgi:hypothetical protein